MAKIQCEMQGCDTCFDPVTRSTECRESAVYHLVDHAGDTLAVCVHCYVGLDSDDFTAGIIIEPPANQSTGKCPNCGETRLLGFAGGVCMACAVADLQKIYGGK